MNISIHVEELSKRFNREWIFRDFSFEFKQGNTYAIIGPNGSGKSTLMQILWGQMPPSKGTVRYMSNENEIPDDLIYQQVSVATPYMDLIDEFTLREQVDFHFKAKPIKTGNTPLKVIEAMYLKDSMDKPISNFSSGMKQRVKLGLAFYTEAQVIFLDEPGTNLDQKAFDWYHQILNVMATDKLICIASNQKAEYPKNAVEINISKFK